MLIDMNVHLLKMGPHYFLFCNMLFSLTIYIF